MKENGPWKITGSEIKYKNPWIEVREDRVIHPNGADGIFGVVEQNPGVSILAMDDEGFVYLVDEFRYALGRNSLETVSGAIDQGESPLDAAKRELSEEVGIQAENWKSFDQLEPLSSVIHSPQHLFFARELTFGESKPESNEVFEVKKVKFAEAVSMVMRNEISYGPSCVLIMKVNEYLRRDIGAKAL